jgi:hypothetical protein
MTFGECMIKNVVHKLIGKWNILQMPIMSSSYVYSFWKLWQKSTSYIRGLQSSVLNLALFISPLTCISYLFPVFKISVSGCINT